MKDVHIFQRFSKKEDVVTNNTMLLFKWLQHHNVRFFEKLLRQLVPSDDLVVGALLTEQDGEMSETIPDGVIRQQSFHIVLETKLHDSCRYFCCLGRRSRALCRQPKARWKSSIHGMTGRCCSHGPHSPTLSRLVER